jgi:hypothetical protein
VSIKDSRLYKELKLIITKPDESKNAHDFFVLGLWFLRILILASGLYQLFFGERFIGLAIVIAVAFLVSPAVFTQNKITDIPLELEFFLFIMVLIQFVIGEVRDFYDNVPYYDKFVHFFLPFFLGFIGFAITYTLYFSGKLKVAVGTMIVVTVVITVGLGALWEIVEYGNDLINARFFPDRSNAQGSLTEDPLHDTMNDLVADTLGGVGGAALAGLYVFRKGRIGTRKKELLKEINRQLSKRKHPR